MAKVIILHKIFKEKKSHQKRQPGPLTATLRANFFEIKRYLHLRHVFERHHVQDLESEDLGPNPKLTKKQLEHELRLRQRKETQRLNILLEEAMNIIDPQNWNI